MTHVCWILTHLLSMCFGMKSSNEGLPAGGFYEAVTNPAVDKESAAALEEDINENNVEKKQTCC